VDEALGAKSVVTGITQFRIVAGPFEFMARAGLKWSGALLGHMASVAPVRGRGLVHALMLRHLRVTIRCRAGRCPDLGSAAGQLLGVAGCERSRSDKTTEHHTYHTSHAQPAQLESPLLHPLGGGGLEFAHPHCLHSLQASPGNAG
jgi:hypothetical protein